MKAHPFASLFPMMSEDELKKLAADIKENGQQLPIITLEGEILDGRNRDMSCGIAGVTPWYEAYQGNNPLAFVVSQNLHRRHLTESQRGMVAARLSNLPTGQHAGPSIDGPGGVSESQAAEMLNVGISTAQRAKRIQRDGAPELTAAVEKGEVTVGAAYKLTSLPKEQQQELVSQGPEAIKKASSELRKAPPTRKETAAVRRKETSILAVGQNLGGDIYLLVKFQVDRFYPEDPDRVPTLQKIIDYCQANINTHKQIKK